MKVAIDKKMYKRYATAICATKTILLSIPRKKYEDILINILQR